MIVSAQLESCKTTGSGFSATQPPPTAAEVPRVLEAEVRPLQPEVARLLYSLGMKGLHASLIDVESMACLRSWHIGEADDRDTTAEDGAESSASASVPTAMATIVHLKATPFDETLTRQLDMQGWAFAWRIDAHRVAVAQARYRLPNNLCTARDVASVRQLCTAGIEAGNLRRADAMNDRFQVPGSDSLAAAATRWPGVKLAPARWADKLVQRLHWPSPWALGLAGAVCLAAAVQIESSREGEARRFRQLTDATMTQQLARVLAAGDYGEVQASLETFAGLGYFKGAVVVDARRHAVASVGAVPDLRIGQGVTGPLIAGARAVPLKAAASNTEGRLLIWGPETPSPGVSTRLERALFAAGPLLMLATLIGAVRLWRQRETAG